MLGDLRYMSPERTDDGSDVDSRSDLYSLGALLYVLLTAAAAGRREPGGDDAQDPPGRTGQPEEVSAGDPGSSRGMVLKLLAKRPDDRYSSASAVLEDL
jgi:eukaryotic-like serine/threonine-protein kinase